jgi:hypothetical protein
MERDMRTRNLLLAVLMLWRLPGCGGGGGGSSGGGDEITVSVTPTSASLPPAGSQAFTARVTNTPNSAVAWSVQEGTAGGSITDAGVYTALNTAGTYHVVAASQADPTRYVVVPVYVHPVVTIQPAAATLTLRQSQNFTASVIGSVNTTVAWNVQEGSAGGSITGTGVYTAPNVPGTFHVVATSQADPTQQATATVTVQAGSASGTIQ